MTDDRLSALPPKVQRSAQKEHLALYAPALGKTRNRLVDDRLKYGGGNVLLFGSLVYERLDIRLCEHAAAGRYWVDLLRL